MDYQQSHISSNVSLMGTNSNFKSCINESGAVKIFVFCFIYCIFCCGWSAYKTAMLRCKTTCTYTCPEKT